MRICRTCKIKKEIIYFGKNKKYKDGLSTECKNCASIRGKRNYQNTIEKRRLSARLAAKRDKDKRREYQKSRGKKYL